MAILPHKALRTPSFPKADVRIHDDLAEERRVQPNRLVLFAGNTHMGGKLTHVLMVKARVSKERAPEGYVYRIYHAFHEPSQSYVLVPGGPIERRLSDVTGEITASIPIDGPYEDIRVFPPPKRTWRV